MRKQHIAILSLALVAVLAASYAFAGPGYGRGGGCPGWGGGYNSPAAQLTSEQQDKLRTIMAEHQQKVLPLRQQMYAKRSELSAATAQADPDMDKVYSLMDEINDLQKKMVAERTALDARIEKEVGVDLSAMGYGRGGGYGMHGRGGGHRGGHGGGYGPGNRPNAW